MCSVSFVRKRTSRPQHTWCCMQVCALLKKIPFCHSQVPSNPCASLVWCEGTGRQVLTVCRSFPPASGPPVLYNLPVSHTAQQAPTGELMMFSPLWSHSSLSKLLTIYLDVIIVCNIIKEVKSVSVYCSFVLSCHSSATILLDYIWTNIVD